MYMKPKSNRVDCDDEHHFGPHKTTFATLGGSSSKYFGLMSEDMVMDGTVKKAETHPIISHHSAQYFMRSTKLTNFRDSHF